jgi:hypothetical protein
MRKGGRSICVEKIRYVENVQMLRILMPPATFRILMPPEDGVPESP